MTSQEFTSKLNEMYGEKSLDEIKTFFEQVLQGSEDRLLMLVALNEYVGFCRDNGYKADGINACETLSELVSAMELGPVEEGSSWLNIANAYRGMEEQEKAKAYFERAKETFARPGAEIPEYLIASFHNNYGLFCQEINAYERAEEAFLVAAQIISQNPSARMELATTLTNLAITQIRICRQLEGDDADQFSQAAENIKQALSIFEEDGGRDFHYPAALAALGDALAYKESWEGARQAYHKALYEQEKRVGRRAQSYLRLKEYYEDARSKCAPLNIDRCRQLFLEKGKDMVEAVAPELGGRYSAGIVGEGSDAFGFEDELSRDHDFELGFCIFLDDAEYEAYGEALKKAYLETIGTPGIRRGVIKTSDFYERVLDLPFEQIRNMKESKAFSLAKEDLLATATNGRLFHTGAKLFDEVREALGSYYPSDLQAKLLAQSVHDFSQKCQYNYQRMLKRGDVFTAGLCLHEGLHDAMHIVYLLNNRYMPYYKLARRGLDELDILSDVKFIIDEIADISTAGGVRSASVHGDGEQDVEAQVQKRIEMIASRILEELLRQGYLTAGELSKTDRNYLDAYAGILAAGRKEAAMTRDEMIEAVVSLEWEMFQATQNEGGRAECQNNFYTFNIMRRSQYMAFPDDLLESYLLDLAEAKEIGRNLITEKYGRMMESTAPEEYEKIKHHFPELSAQRIELSEQIIAIQVGWMEEFAAKYPKFAGNARSIHTSDDRFFNTSYETYLRGELGTYSDETLTLYGRMVVKLAGEGKSLTQMIMQNTADLYGYSSIDEAESRIM